MFSPICVQKVPLKEYNAHSCKCVKFAQASTCVKLPEEDTCMAFKQVSKHMLERPSIVCVDTACSLRPTNDANNVAEHVANSACFYFLCT